MRHIAGAGIRKMAVMPLRYALLYPSIYGAYTELYCGLSPDLTTADNGMYIAPWGRKYTVRKDIEAAMKNESEGGTGKSEKFMDFVRRETKSYL